MKIGVMFGSPETTTGGNALKFYASVRMDIRRTGSVKVGDEVVGSETKVKVVKNKVAPPFRIAEFNILYGEGVSKVKELVDSAVELKMMEKAGSWFTYKGERFQGQANIERELKARPELMDELETQVRAQLMGDGVVVEEGKDAA